jgi:hypothetical protein
MLLPAPVTLKVRAVEEAYVRRVPGERDLDDIASLTVPEVRMDEVH